MRRSNSAFKEFAEENYSKQSIQVAETFILKNKKNILWFSAQVLLFHFASAAQSRLCVFRVDKDKHTVDEMQKLLKVNCLRQGDFAGCKGKKWMVGIDGSLSSYLALEETMKLADPAKDHIFVTTGSDSWLLCSLMLA